MGSIFERKKKNQKEKLIIFFFIFILDFISPLTSTELFRNGISILFIKILYVIY